MSAADRFDAPLLRNACIEYILGPAKNDVISHPTFKQELEAYPSMLFPIIHRAGPPEDLPIPSSGSSPPSKRQKTDSQQMVIRPHDGTIFGLENASS